MSSESSSREEELFEPRRKKTKQRLYHRWTLEENQKYIKFLQEAREDFEQEYTRRIRKVFKRLSQFMGTKNQSQCKSHHQKMVKQHQTLENVITQISKKIETQSKNRKDQEKQMSRFNMECRKRIRKIFRKLSQFMNSKSPHKTLQQQVCILRVFTSLSKAIDMQLRNEEIESELSMMDQIAINKKYEEKLQEYFRDHLFDEHIFNVIDF